MGKILIGMATWHLLEEQSEWGGALSSLERFCQSVSNDAGCEIGIVKLDEFPMSDAEHNGAQLLSTKLQLPVTVWDVESREALKNYCRDRGVLFVPYGGNNNQLALLSKKVGADWFLRLDRDCCPHPEHSLKQIISAHGALLDAGCNVVSGGYEGRLALTDEFIAEEKRKEWYDFVYDHTGVDSRTQLIAGACLSTKVPLPTPTFLPGREYSSRVLSWASDDAFYGLLNVMDGRTVLKSNELVIQKRSNARRSRKFVQEYVLEKVGATVCLYSLFQQITPEMINGKEMFLADVSRMQRDYERFVNCFVSQFSQCIDLPKGTFKPVSDIASKMYAGFDEFIGSAKEWQVMLHHAKSVPVRNYLP
ncbi:hypothetical protein HY486_02595 [Candidatus Woesearchaeota archaeon]|nr:hypothetical protein [Candidatus Woesearchaeota archaeon]